MYMLALLNNGLIKMEYNNKIMLMDYKSDMIYYTNKDKTYRRTLMNDIIEIKIDNNIRKIRYLNENEKIKIVNDFYNNVKMLSEKYNFLDNNIKDYNYLYKRSVDLIKIYDEKIPIVPPDQYFSLYIRISYGCPWNKCTFCNLYKDQKYNIIDFSSLKKQINDLILYFGDAIKSRKGIFLGDANAINIKNDILTKYLKYINDNFNLPLYAFSDAFTTPYNNNDFNLLKKYNMKRIYIGIESGDPEILKILNKKMDIKTAIKFINKIKDNNINVGLIFMSGFGNYNHVENTINFIKNINLGKGDIVYISPLKEYNDFNKIIIENNIDNSIEVKNKQFIELKNSISKLYSIPVVLYDINEALY